MNKNIIVDLNYPIKDGTEVVFRSPVDCSQVTGLIVYYLDNGNYSKEFAFADANGNNVGDIDHLFAENVVVKVILDVTAGMAFVQNADTNAYLEGRFAELEGKIGTGGGDSNIVPIPMTGYDLDSLASCEELVIGALYVTTTEHHEAFVDAPAGTLYLAKGESELAKILTADDKEEIVQSVLDALPIYGGETEEVVANE